MTELLPKPRKDQYLLALHQANAELEYYKRLAEFAIEVMEHAEHHLHFNENLIAERKLKEFLSTIKQSEQS